MTLTTTATAAAPAANGLASVRPEWFQTLATKKNKGEAAVFILWGSTDDYVVRGYPVARYLGATFAAAGMDVVVRYSLDQGVTFEGPGMERLYRATLGLDGPAPAGAPGAADPQAAAFAAVRKATGQKEPGALPSDPDEAIEQILQFLKLATFTTEEVEGELVRTPKVKNGARHAAAIIERLDLVLPTSDKATMPASRLRLIGRLHRASNDAQLLAAGNPFIMLAPTLEDVAEDVRVASSGMRAIEVPLPNFERRLAFILELEDTCLHCGLYWGKHTPQGRASDTRDDQPVACDDYASEVELAMPAEQVAAVTAGLYLRHIEDIAMLARGGQLTRDLALTRQAELMKAEYADTVERMEPTVGYEVLGGVDYLIEWFRRRVVNRLSSGDPAKRKLTPKGVMLMGPPGTAKSLFAAATAAEAGVNVIQLKPFKSKWQGESVRNLKKALRCVEAFPPVIVFVDEYAEFLGGDSAGGESSTDAELRKVWQEWTADDSHRGLIFLLTATNYPERVPSPMQRPGRIDFKAPMLAPGTPEQRADILYRLLKAKGVDAWSPTDAVLIGLGERTDRYTGSDLNAIVIEALVSVDDGMTLLDALNDAIDRLRPTDPRAVDDMTRTALRYCNDLALLPPDRRDEAVRVQTEPEPEPTSQPVRRSAGRGLEL